MSRIVRCSLIQATNVSPAQAMVDKHLGYNRQAAAAGAQIVCLQEIFNGPYFCAEQETRWYDVAEAVRDGPIVRLVGEEARKRRIPLTVPIYEREQEGIYYNAAAVIGNDGSYVGKYRKTHIPHVAPGFWEKFYFRPGNLGYPVFDLGFARIGVYICYDRHFPEGARALGLNGAEIVFNPSATVAGLSEHLWKLEQPAHAVANGYFIGGIVTVSVGNCNEAVNAKLRKQMDTLQHVSTVFANEPQAALAKKIASITPEGKLTKSFFTNSGTEANETAIVAARCYTGSSEIVALRHSYHGRSALAMTLTAHASWRLGGVPHAGIVHAHNAYCYRCPFGLTYPDCNIKCAQDVEDLIRTTTSGRIAGFIPEPIQCAGGVCTRPRE